MRVLWSGFQFLTGKRRKTFTANRVKAQSVSRRQFAAMLRHPFPEATDREIARHWAPRLTVHERTVLNWLAETHSASIEDVFIVGATHGVWSMLTEDEQLDVANGLDQAAKDLVGKSVRVLSGWDFPRAEWIRRYRSLRPISVCIISVGNCPQGVK